MSVPEAVCAPEMLNVELLTPVITSIEEVQSITVKLIVSPLDLDPETPVTTETLIASAAGIKIIMQTMARIKPDTIMFSAELTLARLIFIENNINPDI